MGRWLSMAKKFVEPVKSRGEVARLAQLQSEHGNAADELVRAERALDEALLSLSSEEDERKAERLRGDVREIRERRDDLSRLVVRVRSDFERVKSNAEATARAKAIARAREHADEMTAALRQMSAAGDMAASAARSFFASRDRFLEACPSDLTPSVTPPLWINPGQYLLRHIGARCPMFRSEALRGNDGRGIDYLAQVDEMALIHGDVLSRTFPTEPPSQAA